MFEVVGDTECINYYFVFVFVNRLQGTPSMATTEDSIEEEINLSSEINFVEAAQSELQFLKLVDRHQNLFQGPAFKNALRRYELLWLPLFNNPDINSKELQAPLDIEWIWQAHILDLRVYEIDCRNIMSKEVDHRINTDQQKEQALKKARDLWEKAYPTEPFEVDLQIPPSSVPIYKSQVKCDFQEACARLRNLYHNVSLPHYEDAMFLMSSLKRYRQHLALSRDNSSTNLLPCCDFDLIWKTHLLHPVIYKADSQTMLGYVLEHPETKINALEITKYLAFERETKEIWEKHGMTFSRPGAMFRGESPFPPLIDAADAYRQFAVFEFEMELMKFETENFEKGKTFSFTLHLGNKAVIWKKRLKGGSHSLGGEQEPLAKFIVNTDDKTNITLSFHQKKLLSKTPKHCHTIDLTECLETALSAETVTHAFRIPIPIFGPANRRAYVSVRTCESPKPISYRFTLNPEPEFAKFPHPVNVLSAPKTVLKREILTLQRLPCELSVYCVHSYCGKPAFTCRVLNAEPADVLVMELVNSEGNTVASAHLVDNTIFPSHLEPLEDSSKCVTTNMSGSETALLIRGRSDWGICVGVKTTHRMSLDDEQNIAKIKFFRLGDKQGWCDVKKTENSLLIRINPNEDKVITMNPDQGQMILPVDIDDVPECIAAGLSSMLLPSLCYLVNSAEDGSVTQGNSDVKPFVLRCPTLSRYSSSSAT